MSGFPCRLPFQTDRKKTGALQPPVGSWLLAVSGTHTPKRSNNGQCALSVAVLVPFDFKSARNMAWLCIYNFSWIVSLRPCLRPEKLPFYGAGLPCCSCCFKCCLAAEFIRLYGSFHSHRQGPFLNQYPDNLSFRKSCFY